MVKEALHDALFVPGENKVDLAWSRWLGGASFALLWTLAVHAGDMVIEANFDPHNDEALGLLAAWATAWSRRTARARPKSPTPGTTHGRGTRCTRERCRCPDGINTTGR